MFLQNIIKGWGNVKISTKGRYGLRLMVDLALEREKSLVSLKEIARHQDISEKYLEQIVTQLNKASLVKSTRGAQGGYSLARAPQEITVGDVLRVVEGGLMLVDCIDDKNKCARSHKCPTAFVWQKLSTALEQAADSITLLDLAELVEAGMNQSCII